MCFFLRIESSVARVVSFAIKTRKEHKMQPERTAFYIC